MYEVINNEMLLVKEYQWYSNTDQTVLCSGSDKTPVIAVPDLGLFSSVRDFDWGGG